MTSSLLYVFLSMVCTHVSGQFVDYKEYEYYDDCEKFCLNYCDDLYFSSPEYNKCMEAIDYCACDTGLGSLEPIELSITTSTSNRKIEDFTIRPVASFIIVSCIATVVIFCGLICKCIKCDDSPRQNDVPIQQTTVIDVPVRRISSNTDINVNPGGPFQDGLKVFINPAVHQSSHVPAEYMEPPPAYIDCVRDANFQSETERLMN